MITDRRFLAYLAILLTALVVEINIVQSHGNSEATAWLEMASRKTSYTWLRAFEVDLKLLNISLSSAWNKVAIRENLWSIEEYARDFSLWYCCCKVVGVHFFVL